MKAQAAIDIRQFMQHYHDAWEDNVTETILSYCSEDVARRVVKIPHQCANARSPDRGPVSKARPYR